MTNRRGALMALLGAPFAAKTAISEGVSSVANLGMQTIPNGALVPGPPSAWQKLLMKFRRKEEDRNMARERLARHLPSHIAERKSWSSAFKSHVYLQEVNERVNLWDMDDDELAAYLIKRGYKLAGGGQ